MGGVLYGSRLRHGMWVRPMSGATGPVRSPFRQVDVARRTTTTSRSGHTEHAVWVRFTNGECVTVHPYSEWDIDEAASL